MGKKVKKVFNKVGKTIRKLDPVTAAVEDAVGGMGLPTLVGETNGMLTKYGREQEAAKALAAEEAAERERQAAIRAQQDALRAQQEQDLRDANADLRNVDVADVNIGAAADTADRATARKRKQGVSLSESIGLRV